MTAPTISALVSSRRFGDYRARFVPGRALLLGLACILILAAFVLFGYRRLMPRPPRAGEGSFERVEQSLVERARIAEEMELRYIR